MTYIKMLTWRPGPYVVSFLMHVVIILLVIRQAPHLPQSQKLQPISLSFVNHASRAMNHLDKMTQGQSAQSIKSKTIQSHRQMQRERLQAPTLLRENKLVKQEQASSLPRHHFQELHDNNSQQKIAEDEENGESQAESHDTSHYQNVFSRNSSGKNSESVDLTAYSHHVRQAMMAHRVYPLAAKRLGIEGTTMIRLTVKQDGYLENDPVVVSSSGSEILDREAVRIAQVAAPFPALPETFVAQQAEFVIPIGFQIYRH